MMDNHREELERLMAEYRERYDSLRETQRLLREISCTVTAPRQTVSVTAGHGGAIKEIKFPTGAYRRMAPAELAAAVLEAIGDAQKEAMRQAAEVMAPHMPKGFDAGKLFSGTMDLRSLMSPEPELHETVRDVMKIRD